MTTTHTSPRVLGATDEERRLIEALYRAIGGEPDLLDEVLAPDWEDIPSIPDQVPGPAGMKPHIVAFHEAFADARVIIHDIVASSGLVAVRGALAGTLRSEFFGVAPNGRYDEITVHEFHEINNGRITRSWHLEDLHGWMSRMKA
jgi:predicted ester cyclase